MLGILPDKLNWGSLTALLLRQSPAADRESNRAE